MAVEGNRSFHKVNGLRAQFGDTLEVFRKY